MKTLSYFVDTHHVLLDWDLCPWKSHWIFLWGYRWFCITCLVLLFLRLAFFQFFSVTAIVGADCGSTIDLVVMPCSPWMEKESVHFVLVYLFNRMRSVISIIIYVILPLTRMIYIYRWFIILIFMDVIKIARSRNAITNLYWDTCMIILWSSWVTHLSISFHRSCCSR